MRNHSIKWQLPVKHEEEEQHQRMVESKSNEIPAKKASLCKTSHQMGGVFIVIGVLVVHILHLNLHALYIMQGSSQHFIFR